jgi:hypothetical protein
MVLLSLGVYNTTLACDVTPTPTNTPQPTNTPTNPPTYTPTQTNVPACIPYDTGRVVNVLYMYNTSPLHYGYFDTNGVYVGICRIETASGQVPNKDLVQQYCACDISDFTWVTTRVVIFHIMQNCDGTRSLVEDNKSQDLFMVNWKFGEYCPATKCILKK